MREALRRLLKEYKADIVSTLSEGTLLGLLTELSYYFVDEDCQKIKCDADRRGHSWAADTLVDTLKCSDEEAFTKFMQFLKDNDSTKTLYNKIADECRKRGLESVLACGNTAKEFDKKSEESLHSLIKKVTSHIVDALSEGDFTSMLRHFETDLVEADVQKIKCDLKNNGKNAAISQFIACLLHHGKNTLKKFIQYLLDRKKNLFVGIELEEYGLQDLLFAIPVEEKGATPFNHIAECNNESLPITESVGPPSCDGPPTKKVDKKE